MPLLGWVWASTKRPEAGGSRCAPRRLDWVVEMQAMLVPHWLAQVQAVSSVHATHSASPLAVLELDGTWAVVGGTREAVLGPAAALGDAERLVEGTVEADTVPAVQDTPVLDEAHHSSVGVAARLAARTLLAVVEARTDVERYAALFHARSADLEGGKAGTARVPEPPADEPEANAMRTENLEMSADTVDMRSNAVETVERA